MLYNWQQDKKFVNEILPLTSGITLVGPDRLYVLYQIAKHTKALKGAFAEVGVYKGGTAKLFHKTLNGHYTSFTLYDTFDGMPVCNSKEDLHREGDFSDTSYDNVCKLFQDSFVHIIKGVFPKTIGDLNRQKKYSLVHVDCDIYQSVKDCCIFFYPRMLTGGIIVFDDYGFPSCPGAKKAIDEYCKHWSISNIYLPTGQCIIIKI